jgi:MFS family permease
MKMVSVFYRKSIGRVINEFRFDNIAILHIIKFLSSLYFYHQIITLYFQSRGLNYIQINSMWGIIVGTQAIAEVPTGILGDKIGRKYSVMIALFLQFIGEFIFIFADSYMFFVSASIIGGIGFSFMSGSFEAMLYDSLKEKGRESEMQKIAGLNNSFPLAATVIGTLVGGYLTRNLQENSFVLVIVITALFVFLSLIVSFFLREPLIEYKHEKNNSFRLLKDGVKLLRTNKSLQKIILLSLLANPFLNYLMMLYQPYFKNADIGGIWFALALATAALLGVFTSKYAYILETRFGVGKGVLLACVLPGIFYLLMAFTSYSWLCIALVVLAFSSMHIQRPIFMDYLNRHIESKNRATVLSLISILSGLYIGIAGLLIGWIADFSLQYSFIFMGLIIIISSFSFRINEKHIKTVDSA